MALQLSYDNEAAVPEGLKTAYVESEGKWNLDITGMVSAEELTAARAKVDEFRTNNLSLTEKLAGYDGKKILTTEEQEEFVRLAQQETDIKDKKLIDSGKIDELLASRTEKMRTDFTAQIDSLNTSLSSAKDIAGKHEGRLSKVLVESEVGKVLSASGNRVVQGALEDLFARASSTWRVNEEGALVALNTKGEQIYGTEANPLTLSEWLISTVKEAPYLFESSQGSGGEGNKGTGNKGSDGIIRIPRSDERMKGLNLENLATGKAIMVDG